MRVRVTQGWDRVWAQYEPMIRKIAGRMAKRYPNIPYDDLVAEGIWGAWSQMGDYDSTRCCLCTWVYRTAYHKMLDLCLHRVKRSRSVTLYGDKEEITAPAKTSFVEKLRAELSEEGRLLLDVVLQAPEELHDALTVRRKVTGRRKLVNYMIDVHDWKPAQVERVFEEIRTALV